MQHLDDIHDVVDQISDCDFATAMYANTTGPAHNTTWIACASTGKEKRYFTVTDADLEFPIINLIDYSESVKPIEQVDHSKIVGTVPLKELIGNGYNGVLRGLGLYRALAECCSLRLSDFKPIIFPFPAFTASVSSVDSLEPLYPDLSVRGAMMVIEDAHISAMKVEDVQGKSRFVEVVYDCNGDAIASCYRRKKVA